MTAVTPKSVAVRVPATTANLGPGFDCLGLALDLWNNTVFSLEGRGWRIELQGEGQSQLPADQSNRVAQAFQAACQAAGVPLPANLRIRCRNRIPLGSGMGSSAAAVLAGLLGANALTGSPLSRIEILRLAAQMEGHADNAAAALFGGLVILARPLPGEESGSLVRRLTIPSPAVALVLPEVQLSTQAARAALPGQVPLADAVYNLGRTALVVEALRSGDLDLLGKAMDDRLHQPYRLALIPGAAEAMRAAKAAGASAAALSGAGPSVIAFCRADASMAAAAMQEAFRAAGLPSRAWTLRASESGCRLHLS